MAKKTAVRENRLSEDNATMVRNLRDELVRLQAKVDQQCAELDALRETKPVPTAISPSVDKDAEFLGLPGAQHEAAVTCLEAVKRIGAAINNMRGSARWQAGDGALTHSGRTFLAGAMAVLNQIGLLEMAGVSGNGWPQSIKDFMRDPRPEAKDLGISARPSDKHYVA